MSMTATRTRATHRESPRQAMRALTRDLATQRAAGALPGRGDDVRLAVRTTTTAGSIRVALTLTPTERGAPAGWQDEPADPASTAARHLDALYAGRTTVLRADVAAWAALAAERAHLHAGRTGLLCYVTVTVAGTTIA